MLADAAQPGRRAARAARCTLRCLRGPAEKAVLWLCCVSLPGGRGAVTCLVAVLSRIAGCGRCAAAEVAEFEEACQFSQPELGAVKLCERICFIIHKLFLWTP